MMNRIAPALVAALLIGGVVLVLGRLGGGESAEAHIVAVEVPELGAAARRGQALFQGTCADCHGGKAQGTEQGPPLIHDYYKPSHHGDAAFHRAVRQGVTAHHWHFGDMPPQPGFDQRDVAALVAYVRTLQRANGVR